MQGIVWSKKLKLDFSQALRLLQESQFFQLNTWLVSVSNLYNTISPIVLDPEKNRVILLKILLQVPKELKVNYYLLSFEYVQFKKNLK